MPDTRPTPRPQFAVRTCRRGWLRVKLHFLVERDEKGLRELKEFLDTIAGRKIEIFELGLAVTMFVDDDDTGLGSLLYTYMVVPFWQWRRLTRLMKLMNEQIGM